MFERQVDQAGAQVRVLDRRTLAEQPWHIEKAARPGGNRRRDPIERR